MNSARLWGAPPPFAGELGSQYTECVRGVLLLVCSEFAYATPLANPEVCAVSDAATQLADLFEKAMGAPLPLRIRAWDDSEAGPGPEGPVLVIRHRHALRRILWRPDELGLARGWVAGEIDIDGDLYQALHTFSACQEAVGPNPMSGSLPRRLGRLRDPHLRPLINQAIRLAGWGLPPRPPLEEASRMGGGMHTLGRDRAAISHHYDVGNDFYALVLGESMAYSCAYWTSSDPSYQLADAQFDKLDLICRKLDLQPGQRLLDVGCGWGSMALHAAQHYGVEVVGVTLSTEQATFARKRISDAGFTDRVEIRLQDYREVVDGPFDAISSIGMAEHVGSTQYRRYAEVLYGLLRPRGRLLNHQISRRPAPGSYRLDPFIDAYVFPDGELAPVGTTVSLLEAAGFEVRDVQALREHYALTLRQWVSRLERRWADAVRLTSPGRARVWRLYMAASALAFEQNKIGVNQVLAVRTAPDGRSGMPATREDWLKR